MYLIFPGGDEGRLDLDVDKSGVEKDRVGIEVKPILIVWLKWVRRVEKEGR